MWSYTSDGWQGTREKSQCRGEEHKISLVFTRYSTLDTRLFSLRLGLTGQNELTIMVMEPHGLSPWYLHKNTLLRPWAPKRFGAQAPRLRRVIRQWRNPPKQ